VTYNQMVVDEQVWRPDEDQADLLFNALADATRRDIVRRAAQGEHSVSALAAAYPMSFAAVQKHVAVLERAGLVTKERRGRQQLVHTEIKAIRAASRLLDQFETLWRDRIDRFGEILAADSTSPACP
jgi:DNA-binding transcriptional ArsR family regulator